MSSIFTRALNSLEKKLCEENYEKCQITISSALTAEHEEYWTYSGKGIDENGDAFRHTAWCALMAKKIDSEWARAFSMAHENADPSANALSIKMDLHNNSIGIKIGEENRDREDFEIINLVERAVDQGKTFKINDHKLVPTDNSGKEPYNIFKAIIKGFIRMLIKLVETKGNINIRDSDGRTPLMIACETSNIIAMKILLETGEAEINLIDNFGDTALIIASQKKDPKLLNAIIEFKNIDLNYQRLHDKRSALIMAAIFGNSHAVQILTSLPGIDKSLKDSYGFSAYDHAKNEQFNSLLEFLKLS